ncbi:MAG: glycosyltransferase [Lachnospiraceae bacterium]|nr:glycosyltransferase [Lachnospiraceae bacterium]
MRLKRRLRRLLEKRLDRRYEKNLKLYEMNYDTRLEDEEEGPVLKGQEDSVDFEVLVFGEGEADVSAKERIAAFFAKYPGVQLVYGDEDIRDETGACHSPWLKQDWSPDSYLCRDYLGSLVAVRREVYDKLTEQERKEEGACHDRLVELAGGYGKGCQSIGHLREVLFHRKGPWLPAGEGRPGKRLVEEEEKEHFVSVIIPSKDHVAILTRCLETVIRTVREVPYEILVVDNGSSEANREKIEQEMKRIGQNTEIRYLYRPMPFNFSHMCNLGAKEARGNLLLFLNDDIEAVSSGWLEALVQKASEEWAGAVGIKLLYPNSERIQHVGVVNIVLGPVHKLQFQDDNGCYYDGRNQGVWNYLAVTGACLMLRREVFEEAGGFQEALQVAFNDVDLCFTLYEAGYHNVMVNTFHLVHHESLSRGHDESEEDQKRLMRERDILYGRHPKLERKDPYYHPRLNRKRLDTTIRPAFEEGRTIPDRRVCELAEDIGGVREDECLRLIVELATARRVQGYAVVLGSDNACFETKLLFQDKERGDLYQLEYTPQCRNDIAQNMPDQKNIALCGFEVELVAPLPPGEYRIGALARDVISGLRIVRWISVVMNV